ncbi:MAG: formylglycine-generating enzyme family protein [Moorea sp. SIO2B7]|nr:formylglycine-generating enzyme family protein [Moorena sp. SIO2B7]
MAVKLKIFRTPKKVQRFVENLNGVPLEMILIPPGSFTMGAPESEEQSNGWERPQHNVSISLFFMGRYPITQAQWKAIAKLNPIGKELKLEPSQFEGDNRPVERVSWQDAIEFCARLSRHTGRNYRLPSEAEWEYACRANTTTPFHFGETISTDLANYDGNYVYGRGEKGIYRKETTEVTKFKIANAFGLSDMHGNIWEWCLDPWHKNYEGAPNDGRVWDKGKEELYEDILKNIDVLLQLPSSHVRRGGSWGLNPLACRSACRGFSNDRIGFRVVCVPPRTP